jgi:hypothetical protein
LWWFLLVLLLPPSVLQKHFSGIEQEFKRNIEPYAEVFSPEEMEGYSILSGGSLLMLDLLGSRK